MQSNFICDYCVGCPDPIDGNCCEFDRFRGKPTKVITNTIETIHREIKKYCQHQRCNNTGVNKCYFSFRGKCTLRKCDSFYDLMSAEELENDILNYPEDYSKEERGHE